MNIKIVPDWTYVNIPAAMGDMVEEWFDKQNITEYNLIAMEEAPDNIPAGLHYPGIDTYDPDDIVVIKSHIDHDQLDMICRGLYG